MWERATRVIIGSANLTQAGYRHQIELALAADLGPHCIIPTAVLENLANEVEVYLDLVPGLVAPIPARQRAIETLREFRERVANQPPVATNVKVAFAPTNTESGALGALPGAWDGARPLWATHLSPFWDGDDVAVLRHIAGLLTGRPKEERWQEVAVVRGPRGDVTFPPAHFDYVDSVHELDLDDGEVRRLHAKCLLLSQHDWIAALIGSSNHSKAGLGLGTPQERRHREVNLWVGAPRNSKEGKALFSLIPLGGEVAEADVILDGHGDDDELDENAPVLPPCFGLCRLICDGDMWRLAIGIEQAKMPATWRVALPSGQTILDRTTWDEAGESASSSISVAAEDLPMFVVVTWDEGSTVWAVVADDRHSLPPGAGLADLDSDHLLNALATGKSLAQAVREIWDGDVTDACSGSAGDAANPLKRFDDPYSLLRRGRALTHSLAAMQRRLERPALTIDTLRARLSGPLGPTFIAQKIVDDVLSERKQAADGLFALAEIALTVGRVNWSKTYEFVEKPAGDHAVRAVLDEIETLTARLPDSGGDCEEISRYAARATKEARRCLVS